MEHIIGVITDVFSWQSILFMLIGIIAGMVIGALPGLSANMGIALLIPVTFVMKPANGLLMLVSLYTAAIYGGSIPAILLHTPGTSASAATAADGFALSQKGQASKAIRISTISSVFGGLVSAILLLLLTPPLSRISLLFGPSEYFLVATFGLTAIASVSSGSIVRGLISGMFGLLLGTVGMDLSTGFPRFTFGMNQLQSGISVVPAMIGLFALSQIFVITRDPEKGDRQAIRAFKDKSFIPRWSEIKQIRWTAIRSAFIGVLIGMLPGAGANISSWISYSQAKTWSKNREQFGKGAIEGISASETANNAATGSSLIPLLTLGIPGSASAAVLLGALLIQGLIPGRALFTTHARLTYTVMVGFVLANIMMWFVALAVVRYMARITSLPRGVLVPIVLTLCVLGSFSVGNNFFDVWIMFAMGVLGYIMRRNNFSPAAALLGLILGPIAERGYRQTLILSHGRLAHYVLIRPISDILIALIIGAIVLTAVNEMRARRRRRAELAERRHEEQQQESS